MRSRLLALVVAGVLGAALAAGSFRLGQESATPTSPPAVGGVPPEVATAPEAVLPDGFTTLVELYERIRSEAVNAPSDEELVEAALQGMLDALDDPYAVYYDADAYSTFSELLDGSFSGVGLMLQQTPDGLEVINVFEDTPADQAGVRVGERIVAVDGTDVRDAPLEAVVRLVQGEEGTEVSLGLEGGPEGARHVTMSRARIEFPVLQAHLLEDGVGHIELLQFTRRAGERVREAVEQLVDDGASGIVLDLRGNPGGLLREAIDVTSVFVQDLPVVQVRERGDEMETYTTTGDALEDVPLVVLVDQGSASASEIVAGALQEHDRSQVVGVTTFGKGTVQSVRGLGDGSGVKFTTAEYFTPFGASLEGVGVVPDVQVEGDRESQLAAAEDTLKAQLATTGPAAVPALPVPAHG